MNVQKVISCVNNNTDYIGFVPLASKAWKNLFNLDLTLGYIKSGDLNLDNSNIEFISDFADIHIFEPIKNIDSGIQSKITRLFLASQASDTINMIVDIDMIPIHERMLEVLNKIDENNLVKWGFDHPVYYDELNFGKWPMDKTTAKGSTFKEIINPDNLQYKQLLTSWDGLGEPKDPVSQYRYNQTKVFNNFNIFSDEALLRELCERSSVDSDRYSYIKRKDVYCDAQESNFPQNLYGRLDRNDGMVDKNNISMYYETLGPRSPLSNPDWWRPIEEYIQSFGEELNDK